jgi:hypothetical protein
MLVIFPSQGIPECGVSFTAMATTRSHLINETNSSSGIVRAIAINMFMQTRMFMSVGQMVTWKYIVTAFASRFKVLGIISQRRIRSI